MTIGKPTIISRETIKPSSATPSYQHIYNLSSIDQLADHKYVAVILFYQNNGNCSLSADEKALKIKKSLSESLTRYYPFAGKLPTPTTPFVDCNDEGILFVEAKSDGEVKTFQHISEQDETLGQLFADGLPNTSIVGVQLNHFACGGLGVAVSMSHKIGDGYTLGLFLNYWASVTRYGSTDHKAVLPLTPHFIHSPSTNSLLPEAQVINEGYANRVMRKFVFPNTKLSDLKNKVIAMAAGSIPPIQNPTRAEVLTSLLYKTAMEAATKVAGSFKPSYLLIPVNMRDKFAEKLPQTSVGNLGLVMMVATRDTSETSLTVTVSNIKKEKAKLEGVQSVQQAAEDIKSLHSKLGNESLEDVAKRSYWCSIVCGFPFTKVDFGWGKPIAGTLAHNPAEKIGFMLNDTPQGDGIEALVILEKEDMEIFENDKEMLSFCHIKQF